MIEIKDLTVSYGAKRVYENFNLSLYENEITCILGESGCGKTTLLNAIASLVPYAGNIPKLKVSYVFQTPRLIPYVSVLKNLTAVGAGENEALEVLNRVNLKDRAADYPGALSGGEAQRVALCRAFVHPSDILLMDEPFSSLDLKTKISVMDTFVGMRGERGRTTLFVTHDIDEAVYLADRIVLLRDGAIALDLRNTEKREYGESNPLRERIIKTLTES